jgi:hypothetical protein
MLEVKPLRGSTTAVAKMHTNSAHPLRRPDIAPATLLFLKGKSLGTKSRMASPTASAAFAVPLPVLVVNDRDGVQHRGMLQLPRRAPATAPGRPSSADLARLRPLMRSGTRSPRRKRASTRSG